MEGQEQNKWRLLGACFLVFMLYSVIGWCYEVFLEVVVYQWGFTNRGVLFGPYCPIYGVGALLFLLCFYRRVKNNPKLPLILRLLLVFLGCMAVATVVELAASYLLEFFTGHWLWESYKNYKINFQGRIALSTSLRFGLGGVIFLFCIQPLFDRLLRKISDKTIYGLALSLLLVVLVDGVYTFFLK